MIHLHDNFIFKTMRLFVGSEFLVSHCRLRKPRHFYGVSPLGTMSDHNWRGFHPRRDLSLLANTRHIFSLPLYSTVRLYWTLSYLTELTQSNTKHSVDSSTMHSHPFNVISPCICNAICHLHVISCHMHNECYMDNTIHTTYRVSWTITLPGYDFHTSLFMSIYHTNIYQHSHATCHSMFKQ